MDMGGGELYHRNEQPQPQPQQPLTLLPPPSSSSSTSSSPTRWPPVGAEEPPGPVPASQVEKEHLFDKVVTPSDVGKLNRLVIPKQHAERYFPLDSSTNEKGLLLNFEDRDGKPWRFRYSYWNSSQSYVMTKGWSRFVKEKRLDAGDTVSFSRGVGESARDRLFIDWKRRPEPQDRPRLPLPAAYGPMMSFGRSVVPWSRFFPPNPPPHPPSVYIHDQHHPPPIYPYGDASSPYLYLRSASSIVGTPSQFGVQHVTATAGRPLGSQFVVEATPVVSDLPHGMLSPPKRVRLFGVDLADDSRSGMNRQTHLRLSIGPEDSVEEYPSSKDNKALSLDLAM